MMVNRVDVAVQAARREGEDDSLPNGRYRNCEMLYIPMDSDLKNVPIPYALLLHPFPASQIVPRQIEMPT